MSFKYFPLTYEQVNKRKIVWDGLAEGQPFGRAALRFVGTLPDFEEVSKDIIPADEIPLIGPVGKYPEWDSDIRNQVSLIPLMPQYGGKPALFPHNNISQAARPSEHYC
jgi:hypothetical protein